MRDFAQLCESLAATSKKLEKVRLLAGFLRAHDLETSRLAAVFLSGRTFPAYDQAVLNVGGAILWSVLESVTGASNSEIALAYRKHGDLGAAGADLLLASNHRAQPPELTLVALGLAFRSIAAARGTAAKGALVHELLAHSSPLEAKYLIKLMSGDLRIGLRESLVEESIAHAYGSDDELVRRANMLLGDIGETLALAAQGRLTEARMRMFHPIGLMLASPVQDAAEAFEYICSHAHRGASAGKRPAHVEDKYDGIRAQAHIAGQQVRLFSRALDEISSSFPELIGSLRRLSGPAILDGEIVAWDVVHSRPLPFSDLQQRIGRKVVSIELMRQVPVAYVAFDVLYTAGGLVIDLPLHARGELLDRILCDLSSGGELRIQPPSISKPRRSQQLLFASEAMEPAESIPMPAVARAPVRSAASPAGLDALFDEAQARGNEGLMIKDPASTYVPGRRGKSWLKLKRELATLDVVVTGVEWGNGRRASVLSDYTFAVREGERLLNVGKAYSGLTDKEIASMTKWFAEHTLEDRGHFRTVDPRIVLEVAFNNVMESDRHESGYALRFPRILRIRTDKSPAQADTLARVKDIFERQHQPRKAG